MLFRNQILALVAFIKYSQKTHNNEKVTENMKIRQKIDPKYAKSLFVQLNGSIYCQKIDDKDIIDATKLIKKLLQYLMIQSINSCPCQDYIWIKGEESIDKLTNEKKP